MRGLELTGSVDRLAAVRHRSTVLTEGRADVAAPHVGVDPDVVEVDARAAVVHPGALRSVPLVARVEELGRNVPVAAVVGAGEHGVHVLDVRLAAVHSETELAPLVPVAASHGCGGRGRHHTEHHGEGEHQAGETSHDSMLHRTPPHLPTPCGL